MNRFNDAFKNELDPNFSPNKEERLLMQKDPRTRKWHSIYREGKLVKPMQSNLKEILTDLYGEESDVDLDVEFCTGPMPVLERETCNDDILVQYSPDEEKMETKLIEVSAFAPKTSKKSSTVEDIYNRVLDVPYSSNTPVNFRRNELKSTCPYIQVAEFFHEVGLKYLALEKIYNKILPSMSMELASSFSEALFSYIM